jgi:hypothetical protein
VLSGVGLGSKFSVVLTLWSRCVLLNARGGSMIRHVEVCGSVTGL